MLKKPTYRFKPKILIALFKIKAIRYLKLDKTNIGFETL